MSNFFLGFRCCCLFLFISMVLVSNLAHSQTRSDQSISAKESLTAPIKKADGSVSEHDVNPATYSKSGSDSVSLIIFGRVIAPKVASKESAIATKTAKEKKKEKFSIKSSDKLKTNNSLY